MVTPIILIVLLLLGGGWGWYAGYHIFHPAHFYGALSLGLIVILGLVLLGPHLRIWW